MMLSMVVSTPSDVITKLLWFFFMMIVSFDCLTDYLTVDCSLELSDMC